MANQAAKSSWQQPNLFGDDQGDLFGEKPAAIFTPRIPKERHVRNALKRLVGEMEEAEEWPWPKSTTRNYRDHWLEHLCALLQAQDEADEWRKRIARNFERLEASDPELKKTV